MQEECRAIGNFAEAENVKLQLIDHIHSFERKQMQQYDETAEEKLEAMERENEEQEAKFRVYWDEKLGLCEQESKNLEMAQLEKQEQERELFKEEAQEKFAKSIKMSSRFFTLQSKLNQLSKLNRFDEAAEVQAQLEEEQQRVHERHEATFAAQMQKKLEHLTKNQEKEFKSLIQKLQSTQNELIKAREKGYNAMKAKFRAQRAFVENKINLERAAKIRYLQTFDPVKNIKVSKMYVRPEEDVEAPPSDR